MPRFPVLLSAVCAFFFGLPWSLTAQLVSLDPPSTEALVFEAESFDFEEGGKVARAVGRPGTTGECLTTWNNAGHVLGWSIEVPEAGEYTLTLRMAAGRSGNAFREVRIDGKIPDPAFARLVIQPSGGFGKDLSHWRNITLGSGGRPVSLALSQGKHEVRMKNLGGEAEDGGVNLDQFYLTKAGPGAVKAQAGDEPPSSGTLVPLALEKGLLIDAAFRGAEGSLVDGMPCFARLGSALKRIPAANSQPVAIRVRPGVYRELVRLTVANVTLIGEGAQPQDVVFTYDLSAGTPVSPESTKTFGTSGSVSFLVSADGFRARNVTFENSWDPAAHPGVTGTQAVALRINGTEAVFENCRFLGHQDTLYADQGLHYFHRCFIQGDVDFIFGSGQSVFDQCEVRSLARVKAAAGGWSGYVSAASTKVQQSYGYLFYRSTLTADPEVPEGSVALGRPWRPSSDASAVPSSVFRECVLGAHISVQGWTDMGESLASTARFFEVTNTGPGAVAHPARRQPAEAEWATYTPQTYLAGWDFQKAAVLLLSQ